MYLFLIRSKNIFKELKWDILFACFFSNLNVDYLIISSIKPITDENKWIRKSLEENTVLLKTERQHQSML